MPAPQDLDAMLRDIAAIDGHRALCLASWLRMASYFDRYPAGQPDLYPLMAALIERYHEALTTAELPDLSAWIGAAA